MKAFKKRPRSDSSQAKLHGWGATWGARALYIGPALGLSPHRNAVAVVALGLDGTFAVANNPGDATAGSRRCRSALIPPDTLHCLSETDGRMAFLYVDAASHDFERLTKLTRSRTKRAGFDLTIEEHLISLLRDLADGTKPWQQGKAELNHCLAPPALRAIDTRARVALDQLHANSGRRLSLEMLADKAGISSSRLRRLFKTATGVPFRRYRIWIAMGSAMRAIGQGRSLTTAALDAGFSSSAHFSAAFREMFGMEPSRLIKGRRTVRPTERVAP